MGYIGDELSKAGAKAENFAGIRETARNFTTAIESRFKGESFPEAIFESFLDVVRQLGEHAESTSASALAAENERLKKQLAEAQAAASSTEAAPAKA